MKSFSTYIPTSPAKFALWLILSTSFLNYSCSDPATVGLQLAPGNNQIGVFFTEFELPAEVILLDSFNTTNQGVLVVGEEEDAFFGKTSGTGYTRLFIDVNRNRPSTNAIFDSAFFTLDFVSVNGEDLDKPKYFSVHKLTEPILDTTYYNFNELVFDSKPFTKGEILFNDIKDTTVFMEVDEEFALEMFGKIQRGREFNNLFSFRDYFPGIAVKGRKGDNTTVGLDPGLSMGFFFFYHIAGDTVPSIYQVSSASSLGFSTVKSDRSGTPTQIVTERGKFYNVGPLVGMKANLGMTIKLDTSPFDAFLDTLQGVTFNQVNFEFGKIEPFAEDQNPISSIYMYYSDNSNQVLTRRVGNQDVPLGVQSLSQTEIDANGNILPAFNNPAFINFNPNDGTYRTQIASYMSAVYRKDIVRRDWILYGDQIRPNYKDSKDAFRRSFRQLVVNQENIKVRVIYSKIR